MNLLNRSLRQFSPIENIIGKVLESLGIEDKLEALKSDRMKYLESCIEAPLQLCLQIYIFIAGQLPGNEILLIYICSSLFIYYCLFSEAL